MEYNVINGELEVTLLKVTYVSTSSTVMVGEIKAISLFSAFEGPPEELIVGVTIPTLPSVIPADE
ncbi:spore gernimation protein GerPD [Paenibacillus prosopidis]|uniref:Spore germination protein PD n=1 Tax=Paenibacillus prosopidis TaxID=630520 RepID=A0A368WCR1_9BACL|nr:spore gernimation protein GerPD [Paenibacillus prosopidis]RCW51247.1 spore germination protein PD [Paenibacillus prosopidis]